MKINIIMASTALVALTACGSSVSEESFDSFGARIQAQAMLIEDLNLAPTSDADLKVSGSADYSGAFSVSEVGSNVDDLTYLAVGEADVNVNFGTGAASGSAGNFFEIDLENSDLDSENVSDISGTAIAGSFDLNADGTALTGNLVQVGGENVTYDLAVDDVAYFGANQEVLEVDGSGMASNGARSGFFFEGLDATLVK